MEKSAHTLNCLMCGAPARSDASKCAHCGARLATVACPSCFGMIFQGSKFCPLCGSRADRNEAAPSDLQCPDCAVTLNAVDVGAVQLSECGRCEGLWVNVKSFEQICADREPQSAILGAAVELPPPITSLNFRYRKCPVCRQIMHRVNFAGSSGVIVDVCKKHGTWFDAKELHHIINFIRTGGMERAREKQINELERSRRELERERTTAGRESRTVEWQADTFDVVAAAGGILARLLRRY